MPSTRITLVKNSNRTQRSLVLLSIDSSNPEATISSILNAAEKKLRIRKPSRIFLDDGTELNNENLSRISSKSETVLFISSGESFVGRSKGGLEDTEESEATVSLIGSSKFQEDHVEPQAIAQLKAMAKLSGITRAVGMPDLHPGDKYPIGAVFESVGGIYPALIGGDVGCGMALFQTRLSSSTNAKRICDKLRGLEGPWKGGNPLDWLAMYGFQEGQESQLPGFVEQLGTIGGGNHFAEVQQVEQVLDMDAFESLGLEKDKLVLLVHSGSRGLGKHIAKDYPLKLVEGSQQFEQYLKQHDWACNWAKANRDLIAHRIYECLDTRGAKKVLDIWHNNVTQKKVGEECVWLHRKGAAPSDQGPVVVPGSRGALSYLVVPVGEQRPNSFSLAHGAGRRLTRGAALGRSQNKASTVNASAAALEETALGSRVICEDVNLLFEEAPEAYKDVEAVVEELVRLGIVKVVASYKPVVTYKKRTHE